MQTRLNHPWRGRKSDFFKRRIQSAKKVCGVAAGHVRGITSDTFSGYFIPYAQSLWSTVQSVHELIYLPSRHRRTFWH